MFVAMILDFAAILLQHPEFDLDPVPIPLSGARPERRAEAFHSRFRANHHIFQTVL
jgi:hypothetical protein